MVKKKVNQKILKTIQAYRKVLDDQKIKVEKLILFGSQAKGKAKSSSDIDLCVVSSQFGKNRFEERVRLMKLTIGVGDDIEPHPYSPSGLKDKWDPLASEIRRYGLEII